MKVELTHHCHRAGCVGTSGDVIEVNEADARWLASVGGAKPADEQATAIFGRGKPKAEAAADDDEGPGLEEEDVPSEPTKPETADAQQVHQPQTATKPLPKRKK